jgi:hypothetical protein
VVECSDSFDVAEEEVGQHDPILVPDLEGVADAVGFGLAAADCQLVSHVVEVDHAGRLLGRHKILVVVELGVEMHYAHAELLLAASPAQLIAAAIGDPSVDPSSSVEVAFSRGAILTSEALVLPWHSA